MLVGKASLPKDDIRYFIQQCGLCSYTIYLSVRNPIKYFLSNKVLFWVPSSHVFLFFFFCYSCVFIKLHVHLFIK